MPMFNIDDRDYIDKLNQLAEDSTNASSLKAEMEALIQEATQILNDQQALALTPENWIKKDTNHRMNVNERLLADSQGANMSVFFPSTIEAGNYFTIKALGNNVLIRPESYTLSFPRQGITSPDFVNLSRGEVVTFVATSASHLEAI